MSSSIDFNPSSRLRLRCPIEFRGRLTEIPSGGADVTQQQEELLPITSPAGLSHAPGFRRDLDLPDWPRTLDETLLERAKSRTLTPRRRHLRSDSACWT